MRPTAVTLGLIAGWALIGVLGSLWPQFAILWMAEGGILLGLLLLDALVLRFRRAPEVERHIPQRFALGVDQEARLTIRNRARYKLRLSVFDGVPGKSECREMPWKGDIEPRSFATILYPVKLLERGRMTFTPTHLLIHSPMGLWQRRLITGDPVQVRVYPNYEPIIRFALLALQHQESQMGIIRRNWVGMSREFHQLREYQEGDVLSQIDWKATSKRAELISREFQEQRDQSIVFLVDSGRRMRAMDGELSQFDHCLNAMLLLSFFALRQGDQVGILSFGGTKRWLPPVKGPHSMPTILNQLYDFETTTSPSDFREAAETLAARQKRRALVIILTNLRTEDSSYILPAVHLIRNRHLVLLASLRESSLVTRLQTPIASLDDAITYGATEKYFQDRAQLLEKVRRHGIPTVDETPQNLPIALTNRYFEIKNSGML